MAQAGNCYEDNPSNYVHFLGIHAIRCWGFNYNYFDCEERCPFSTKSPNAEVYMNKSYTIFGDSKCQYVVKEKGTEIANIFIHKESEDLLIYHSYDIFQGENVNKTHPSFIDKNLKSNKTIHMNEYLLVVNTGNKPLSFTLNQTVQIPPEQLLLM